MFPVGGRRRVVDEFELVGRPLGAVLILAVEVVAAVAGHAHLGEAGFTDGGCLDVDDIFVGRGNPPSSLGDLVGDEFIDSGSGLHGEEAVGIAVGHDIAAINGNGIVNATIGLVLAQDDVVAGAVAPSSKWAASQAHAHVEMEGLVVLNQGAENASVAHRCCRTSRPDAPLRP